MITTNHITNYCEMSNVKVILEIGTGSGELAEQILTHQRSIGIECDYLGFDLFEDYGPRVAGCTEINVDDKIYMKDVLNKLRTKTTGNVKLFKGDTNDTLPAWAKTNTVEPDLVIINGSHLHQTILKDFFLTNPFYKHGTYVIFDYVDADAKSIVQELDWYGPRQITDSVTSLYWKKEGTGPIEFISEPGPV
jgi:hypothetical protein